MFYIVQEVILNLPLKLKTVILTLVICREFQLMAILDKKINIKLVEMLVDRKGKCIKNYGKYIRKHYPLSTNIMLV